MVVIYEVNLTINDDIENAFLEWLEEHIKEILTFEGFQSANINKVEVEGSTQYSVQYQLTNRESLQSYFDNHAQKMREDGIKRFGNQFSATRRILHQTKSF